MSDGSFDAVLYDRSLFTPTQRLSVKTQRARAERMEGKCEGGCFNEGGGQTAVVGQKRIVVK